MVLLTFIKKLHFVLDDHFQCLEKLYNGRAILSIAKEHMNLKKF